MARGDSHAVPWRKGGESDEMMGGVPSQIGGLLLLEARLCACSSDFGSEVSPGTRLLEPLGLYCQIG
jgi:hypothetical protein